MSGSFSFLKGRQHSADTSHGRDLESMLIFQVAAGPGKSFLSSVSGIGSRIGQKQVEKFLKGPHCFVILRKIGTKTYSNLPSESVFANCAGMLVVVFGLLVLYILLASSWKRPEPGMQAEREVWGLGLLLQVGVGPGLRGQPVEAWALPGRPTQ